HRVETRGPYSIDLLPLADDRMAVRVLLLHLAIHDFFKHLRIAGGVDVVDEVSRSDTARGLRCEITVAVINNPHGAAVSTLDPVLEIIDETVTSRSARVAVGVVRFVSA